MREKFNKHTMTIHVTEMYDLDDNEHEAEFPAKFEVCYGCQGKGTHVHRGVDGHGLTSADFAEDPDFAEDYWSGAYDVTCEDCHGDRVVAVIDYERIEKSDNEEWKNSLEIYEEACKSLYYDDRIAQAERAFGC